MSKQAKNAMIDEIKRRLGDVRDMLVVDASRIDAVRTNDWRLKLQKQDIKAFTVKNSLARRALHDLGIEALDPVLDGPSTLVWGSEDIVALSREITRWAQEIDTLVIKGGTVDGTQTLDAEGVERLSKSPGRPELLSMIAGAILAPGGNLAAALLGPGSSLAGAIKSIAEPEEEPAAA